MQQFLIPSSGGASQIINIPVSLLSQSAQQPISFITANGQIFQLPNFSQLVVHQNGENGAQSTTGTNATAIAASSSTTTSSAASSSATSSSSGASTGSGQQQQQQQALVINSQGQIISLPVLQPQNGQQQQTTTATVASANFAGNQQQQTVNLSHINLATLTNNNSNNNTNTNNNGGVQLQSANIVTSVNRNSTNTKEEKSDNDIDDNGPTIASMPTNVVSGNGSLTTQVTHHATTVDGVNLDEIREFAKAFKLRRLALGLTQTQVGQALSATKGPAYSQSAICRFEKLDITPKSAAKIKPVLEKWMQEAELKYADRLKTGSQQNFADLLGSDNSKKRKRRTSFTPQALEILNEAFEKNTHPSGKPEIRLSTFFSLFISN